jgi:hypothetical protein
MAITRNIKYLSYQSYEDLLMSENVLQDLGLWTTYGMLHGAIEEIDSEARMVCSNEPDLKWIVNTLEEAHQAFRHVVVYLRDYSVWDFDWFDNSKTILTLSNQSGGRKAFIWEVKEVLVGNKITIDGEEII